jgi:hypothetical protein
MPSTIFPTATSTPILSGLYPSRNYTAKCDSHSSPPLFNTFNNLCTKGLAMLETITRIIEHVPYATDAPAGWADNCFL